MTDLGGILAALFGGRLEGLPLSCKETMILDKYEGEGTAGKVPVETLRFENGALVEHLVHGVPQPLAQADDKEPGHADDAAVP